MKARYKKLHERVCASNQGFFRETLLRLMVGNINTIELRIWQTRCRLHTMVATQSFVILRIYLKLTCVTPVYG